MNEFIHMGEPYIDSNKLQQVISNAFNIEELILLSDLMHVDFEDLPEGGKPIKVRALIKHCQRRKRLPDLVNVVIKQRPHIARYSLLPDIQTDKSPFKGLFPFEEDDANIFFGRESLVTNIVQRIMPTAQHVSRLAEKANFLALIGASGSGKSSVVRAGVIPALRQDSKWMIYLLTPAMHPLETLAVTLTHDSESTTLTETLMADLKKSSRTLHLYARKRLPHHHNNLKTRRLLLVIDQFEELFTLCRDESERHAFIENLVYAVDPINGGTTFVIITLRADFYGHCLAYANLHTLLESYQKIVPAMTEEELASAITQPAANVGLTFEEGVVKLLLRDVGAEPGSLPLMSHALLATWQRREGQQLTLAGYMGAGGVRGAIAKTAESTYQQLSTQQQTIARNIFLRLTELGEGTQYTRRRATFTELVLDPALESMFVDIVYILSQARLITATRESVEVAHEALIRGWPRLLQWLEENRDDLRLHRKLTEAVQTWVSLDKDVAALYRGRVLTDAQEWAMKHPHDLNAQEREFLAVSQAALEAQERAREMALQRELEMQENLLEQERELSASREWELIQARALADSERQRVVEQEKLSAQLQSQLGIRNIVIAFLLFLLSIFVVGSLFFMSLFTGLV